MRFRHSPAHRLVTAATALVALSGCFLSHEHLEGPARTDAGIATPLPFPAGDAAVPGAPDAAAACALSSASVHVAVEPLPGASRCELTHVDDVDVLSAEPTGDGVRIHADFCPDLDSLDCRCDLVVGGVGTDVAAELTTGARYVLDWSASFVSLSRAGTRCDCPTCGCGAPTFFYAADGPPDDAPMRPDRTSFGTGELTCTARTRCGDVPQYLFEAGVDDVGMLMPQGATTTLDGVRVRVVRAPTLPCDCPECRPLPTAAWAAWTPPRTSG